jgi:hypothetical protein
MKTDSSINPMPASRVVRSSAAIEIFVRRLIFDRKRRFVFFVMAGLRPGHRRPWCSAVLKTLMPGTIGERKRRRPSDGHARA